MDGFYVGYMSATAGYGVVLFVLRDREIVGVDAGGVRFDGEYEDDPETGGFKGRILITVPPNTSLVQGVNSGPSGMNYSTNFKMPPDFLEVPFIKITTPLGEVNVKLEKLRELDRESH